MSSDNSLAGDGKMNNTCQAIAREHTISADDPSWSLPPPNPDTGHRQLPPRNEPLLYIPSPSKADSGSTPSWKLLPIKSESAWVVPLTVGSDYSSPRGAGLDQVRAW